MTEPRRVIASAPGKLILMGEHAAVYGRPALVLAMGLRTRVVVEAHVGGDLVLELPDLGLREALQWDALRDYGAAAKDAWEAYMSEPTAERLGRMQGQDPAHVVKIAIAEAIEALAIEPPGLHIEVGSEIPVGAGFGSSASVAVAVAGGVAGFLTGSVSPLLVEAAALETERRQHGRPSGVDHLTVLHGGVQWFERDTSGTLVREELDLVENSLDGLTVFHTGTPGESTGQVVEDVRRRFESRPEQLEELLDAMEGGVRRLRSLLVGGESEADLGLLIRSFERGLEALGVVPAVIQEVIRTVESAGGAAKISGAGGLSGSAAGSLLAYHPGDSEPPGALEGFRRFEASLGAEGLVLEIDS